MLEYLVCIWLLIAVLSLLLAIFTFEKMPFLLGIGILFFLTILNVFFDIDLPIYN